MNALAVSAFAAFNFTATLIIALFMLKFLTIQLAGTPAGEGLAAIAL